MPKTSTYYKKYFLPGRVLKFILLGTYDIVIFVFYIIFYLEILEKIK